MDGRSPLLFVVFILVIFASVYISQHNLLAVVFFLAVAAIVYAAHGSFDRKKKFKSLAEKIRKETGGTVDIRLGYMGKKRPSVIYVVKGKNRTGNKITITKNVGIPVFGTVLSIIYKLVGIRYPETGDEVFDKKFSVESEDEEEAMVYLNPIRVEAILDLDYTYGSELEIYPDAVKFIHEARMPTEDDELLRKRIRKLKELADI